MKRVLDILTAFCGLILLSPLLVLIWLAVRLDSPGPGLHWSQRAGRNGALFAMPKFRTMRMATPDVATDELSDAQSWVTPVGRVLRRTSLDELTQLWPILTGEMSLVGPRPALHSQDRLIALRREAGVDALRPGLTGWAQVRGRDSIPTEEKAALDAEYLARRSFVFDLWILWLTVWAALTGRDVTH